jgi:DNA polymerase-3 subunit epsilon
MKKKIPLVDLEVLVLDCQATLSNPENGHLTEIGWCRTRANADINGIPEPQVESYLVRLPENAEIPRQVTRMTGLKTEDFTAGLLPVTAWEKVGAVAKEIAKANRQKPCPAVIHFSRFEESHLRFLHRQFTPHKPFPFRFICTHQITRRLFPHLPRKGLRAIAGFLGHSVPELRRSSHHVEATVFIWHRSVQLLEKQGIHTLDELFDWLETPLPSTATEGPAFPMPPTVRRDLPHKPGVYRMLRSNGDLLYIGKATSLKNRVNSYFHRKKGKDRAELTLEMLTQAVDIEVTVTGSALEAALLETDEIKRHSPPYNVALRKRDRGIAFFSRDCLHVATQPDENFPIGPLPSVNALAPFGVIGEMLGPGEPDFDNPDLPVLALGTPAEYAPSTECFRSGFELFKEMHRDLLKKLEYRFVFIRNPFNGLMTLGREFHLRHLEEEVLKKIREAQEEELPEESDEEPEIPAERVWTPEAVSKSLEGIVRYGAHLIRRARWFGLLSESSLAWNTGETAGGGRRLLIFRSGAAAYREDWDEGKITPPPPGYARPFTVRQKNFDIVTYDRLQVLTTELRRLVSSETDRNVELRFSPNTVLNRETLRKALQWV